MVETTMLAPFMSVFKTPLRHATEGTWKKPLAIYGTISIVIAVLAELLIPRGNSWLDMAKTLAAVPAVYILTSVLLGILHSKELKEGAVPLKERLSLRKRRYYGTIIIIIALIVAAIISQYVPYTLGGILLMSCFLASVNFMVATEEEQYFIENGIPDPRDFDGLIEEQEVSEDQVQNLEEFEWNEDSV